MKTKYRLLMVMAAALFMVCVTTGSLMAVEETGGIGLKVSQLYDYTTQDENKRGSIVVLDVFKSSPASRHGIEKGDLILQIIDVITRGHEFMDLLHTQLRGPSHTDVKLIMWRPSIMEKFEIELRRMPMVY